LTKIVVVNAFRTGLLVIEVIAIIIVDTLICVEMIAIARTWAVFSLRRKS
jgi:hypothetical protein